MTKHVQSPRDNLRVTAVHWDRSIMDCLGDGCFYRLKGLLQGFIAICSRVKFGKSSVLSKHLMELKLKWPLFSRVNNFLGEEITLGPSCILQGERKRHFGVKETGKEGGKSYVVGTVTYSSDLQKVGWSCAVVCQTSLAVSELKTRGSKFSTFTNDICKGVVIFICILN